MSQACVPAGEQSIFYSGHYRQAFLPISAPVMSDGQNFAALHVEIDLHTMQHSCTVEIDDDRVQ